MECLYCKTVLKTISSLNQHQKTAKYCLSKQQKKPEKQYECCFCNTGFTVKSALHSHLSICKANTPIIQEQLQELDIVKKKLESSLLREDDLTIKIKKITNEYQKKLSEQKLIIEEQKLVIKDFQDGQRKQINDLNDRIQSMAEKAIAKPSTVNKNITTTNHIINNMMPLTDVHLQEHIHNLNTVHVQNGASGYAKYALEYPLKDMILCTDFQRRSCKYKDENGNVVSDPEMTKITKRLFSAIKERNEELINEYSAELQEKWKTLNTSGPSEMNEEEIVDFSTKTNDALEFIMNILSQKRQVNEMADGMRPELFYGFIRELAAGCYRADK
jgi:hypothetical protein